MAFPTREERMALRSRLVDERIRWLDQQRAEYSNSKEFVEGLPTILETFRDKSVLITGATGFMGKLLLEKLLRSCAVSRAYVILRPKKGVSGEDRVKELFSLPLFQPLLQMDPDALKKVFVIPGDCSELGLDISPTDYAVLQEDVSFVFHAAASVRFDDPIKKAVLLNVRGTREMLDLAKGMKNLKAFVHVSTTYCNINQDVMGERVYAPLIDPEVMIRAAEKCDNLQLDSITHKLLQLHPNTYTFTKQIAEALVVKAKSQVPAIISRPSVVAPVAADPLPGWVDNLNGPMGICMGVIMGVLRIQLGDPAVTLDYVPADTATRALILAAWIRATDQKLSPHPDDVDVMNVTTSDVHVFQYNDVMQCRAAACEIAPVGGALRYPRYTLTRCWYYYTLGLIFSHILFAVLVDLALKVAGQPPRMMKVYRRVHHANQSLLTFLFNNFKISRSYFWKALIMMKPQDLEDFDVVLKVDETAVFLPTVRFLYSSVFRRPYDLEKFKNEYRRLFILEVVLWVLAISAFLWLCYTFSLPSRVLARLATSQKMCPVLRRLA